jgi:hypothetical protein
VNLPELDALKATAASLEPALRRAVADSWAKAAQAEHASIASFARFSLELLAVGAPPALVEGAHQAALDEVGHARMSFAIASAYAGAPLGPGPLPLDRRAFETFELTHAACSATVEGCVAETLSALEAAAAAERAEPAAVKHVLSLVAAQEREHAALAYRFVAWALERGGAAVRDAVWRVATDRLALVEPAVAAGNLALEAHGRLAPQTVSGVRERALREVVEPALRTLVSLAVTGP